MINLCYLDETEYFQNEIVMNTGKILGVYVYDTDVEVHCCEITPSYELHFAGYVAKSCSEDMSEILREAYNDDVMYRHCAYVDALPHNVLMFTAEGMFKIGNFTYTFSEEKVEEDEDEEGETISETVDYLRCNGYVE